VTLESEEHMSQKLATRRKGVKGFALLWYAAHSWRNNGKHAILLVS